MYCKKCGTENLEEARFCKACGLQMNKEQSITCAMCGSKNHDIHKFCVVCGHSIVVDSNDSFLSGREYRFIFPVFKNYALSKNSSFHFFIDKKLVKSGYLSDGVDFSYKIMPGHDSYHLLEVRYDQLHFVTKTKTFVIKKFTENKDFNQIKGHLIEFTYQNLFFYYQLKIR
jgi:hypothetical protein